MVAQTQLTTSRIAEWAHTLRWEDVPAHVQDRARDRLLDALSTATAGRDIDVTRVARRAYDDEPEGPCTSWVDRRTRLAGDAAFVNGTSVHCILYEDIHAPSADHPGPVMVPACVAAAEEQAAAGRPVTLRDVLMGILVGYELQIELGKVLAPSVVKAGFRTTSVFGSVSASLAVARVYRLDREQMESAINFGANFAFGIIEGWALAGNEPYMQAGAAGRAGINAAKLGRARPDTAALTFEGPNGYFRAFGAGDAAERFVIGKDWRIMDVWCKPYPVSGGKIRAVDAALAALQDGLRAENVKAVRVLMSPGTMAYPGATRVGDYDNFMQAQNSTQFVVSAALLGRDMTSLETFTGGIKDPEVLAFTRKVELVGEEPRRVTRAEQLDIELNDGTVRSYEVEWAEGRNATVAKMATKLKTLTRGFWPEGTVDDLVKVVTGPVDAPIGEVTKLIRRRL